MRLDINCHEVPRDSTGSSALKHLLSGAFHTQTNTIFTFSFKKRSYIEVYIEQPYKGTQNHLDSLRGHQLTVRASRRWLWLSSWTSRADRSWRESSREDSSGCTCCRPEKAFRSASGRRLRTWGSLQAAALDGITHSPDSVGIHSDVRSFAAMLSGSVAKKPWQKVKQESVLRTSTYYCSCYWSSQSYQDKLAKLYFLTAHRKYRRGQIVTDSQEVGTFRKLLFIS